MEKRVVFRSAWLPYALVAPQIIITVLFFFWPAAQAVWYSFQVQDAFGLHTEFVGLRNFAELFGDDHYLESFQITAFFSLIVAGVGIAISLVLATFADRVVRGALAYKTLLIWPYAVAPAIAGARWNAGSVFSGSRPRAPRWPCRSIACAAHATNASTIARSPVMAC